MKKHLLLFIFFVCSITNAQIKATITSSNDNSPVPYVNIWIENENIGATSNTDGLFEIAADTTNKNIVFSALGFETLTIPANEIKDNVSLINSTEELDEVLLIKRKNEKKLTLGKFKKKKVNYYFTGSLKPRITARYFPYKEEYNGTIFLNNVEFITNTLHGSKAGKVNIRLYEAGENGSPGEYLSDENIIVNVEKGNNIAIADFKNLNLKFPKRGLFIAIEWLIIEDNYYEIMSKTKDGKEIIFKGYSPPVGTIPMEIDNYSFTYSKGKWRKEGVSKSNTMKKYVGKYPTLAMKLHLSN